MLVKTYNYYVRAEHTNSFIRILGDLGLKFRMTEKLIEDSRLGGPHKYRRIAVDCNFFQIAKLREVLRYIRLWGIEI